MSTDAPTPPAHTPASAPAAVVLPADLTACHALIQQLLEAQQQSVQTIARLENYLQQLLRRIYGRSAEKIDAHQLALFEKMLADLTAPAAPTPAAAPQTPASSPHGHGRRKLAPGLPRRRVVHDLPEEQKPCPCCGTMRQKIGEEVTEKLGLIPAQVFVVEHVQIKYACRACEQSAAETGPQIVLAEKPAAPIEKGLAEPSLLAYVIVSKYGDHLPLHRLERILERHGIDIARSTLCDWMAQCAEALQPLYDLMVKEVLGSRVLHTDDSPVDVLDRTLNQTRTGRFWVYVGDWGHPYDVFDYTPSRSRDGPMTFLQDWGKDRRVFLQADAFGGYDGIYRGEAGGQVTEVACLAHCRRKFYEARGTDVATSTQALAYIRLLYDVEEQAREQFEHQAPPAGQDAQPLSALRLPLRQERSVPRLQQFKVYLQAQQAAHGGPVLPKSPMGQAITYALNQWDALCVYASDGDLSIDNNVSERALRRVAVGRANWTFMGSDHGGATAAILFSFIATCQRHQVNPFDYLCDVLTRIAAHPMKSLAQLLPQHWQTRPAPDAPTPPVMTGAASPA